MARSNVDDQVLSQLNMQQDASSTKPSTLADPVIHTRSFANLLETMRQTRGLSKADLAKRAGVDPSTVTRFEQGTRAPERQTILQLADAMTLPMADRDRLLASAGFRSELWDDPLLVELAHLLMDTEVDPQARREARSVVRMAIAFLKLQRLKH